ncbi:fasciclin-like arabinogalactan protein 12 [Quercus suber]|uniref:fasciclin-like arabinogalactan protein 12 n=1 Tax=Quercus suber TaxID=58331 RepID=UPI0032DE5A43
MTKQVLFSLSILLVFLLHCITTLGQPAAAPVQPANAPVQPANAPVQPATPPVIQPAKAPAPVQSAKVPPTKKGVPDVTKILGKAGAFSVFIRLLKSTGVSDQLYGQLNNSKNGFTIFAPTDAAFSSLKAGTINSLSDLQKTQLVQFHILNTVVTLSNFQTLSNPVPTEAGDAGEFPLTVTTAGNQVNIRLRHVSLTYPKTPINRSLPKPFGSVAAKVDASGALSLKRHGNGILMSIGVAFVAFIVTRGLWWC